MSFCCHLACACMICFNSSGLLARADYIENAARESFESEPARTWISRRGKCQSGSRPRTRWHTRDCTQPEAAASSRRPQTGAVMLRRPLFLRRSALWHSTLSGGAGCVSRRCQGGADAGVARLRQAQPLRAHRVGCVRAARPRHRPREPPPRHTGSSIGQVCRLARASVTFHLFVSALDTRHSRHSSAGATRQPEVWLGKHCDPQSAIMLCVGHVHRN